MQTDAFTDISTLPPIDAAADAVRSGLPDAQDRLGEAADNEDFYQFRNERHLENETDDETEAEFAQRFGRFSYFTRTVIRKLSEPLYNPGPTRRWEGDASIATWLDETHESTAVNVRMAQADRAAILNHVAAIQVEATGDPNRPVRYWLWKAHEFEVFCLDNDPTRPWAVCTIERIPAGPGKLRTRYKLWTAAERRTYLTKPYGQGETAGGRRADELVEAGPTPYPGVLPFVFVRNEPAECDFWAGGIGTPLRKANAKSDRRLSKIDWHIEEYLNPLLWAKGIPPEQRLMARVGRFVHLPAEAAAREGLNRIEPEVGALQVALGVEQAWNDLRAYQDSILEEMEIPLTAIRLDASTDLSGVAIVAKAMPLTQRTIARQKEFTEHETALAAKTLAVASTWYGAAGWNLAGPAAAAALDPRLLVVWPEPKIPLPTPERDQSDQWEIEQGLADPIEVLAKRRGVTIEQAVELATQIAERRRQWAAIMGVEETPPGQQQGQQGQQQQDGEGQQADAEDDPDETPED
jgi:hypothetical protein